ncbi:MAG: 30S ribosomal protein S6 [Candidatus Lloydbacteria bacterium]|nr:30S ribosomal protein S6 [Candidatus Lloydbacteria bacterium]
MNEEEKDIMTPEQEPRIYELGFLLVPALDQASVSGETAALRDLIIEKQGIIISEGEAKERPLAYQMSKMINNKKEKFNRAYFGWIKFETTPHMALEIKSALDIKKNILRFLVIKTTREEAAIERRMAPKKKSPSKIEAKGKKEEAAKPISQAELDKTIDELVISE